MIYKDLLFIIGAIGRNNGGLIMAEPELEGAYPARGNRGR